MAIARDSQCGAGRNVIECEPACELISLDSHNSNVLRRPSAYLLPAEHTQR